MTGRLKKSRDDFFQDRDFLQQRCNGKADKVNGKPYGEAPDESVNIDKIEGEDPSVHEDVHEIDPKAARGNFGNNS